MLDVLHLRSLDELRNHARQWDDLWWRSSVTLPSARAEFVARWVEQFDPTQRFRAIVVRRDGQWKAALPLVHHRVMPLLAAGGLPSNPWSAGGDLLWDGGDTAEHPEIIATEDDYQAHERGNWGSPAPQHGATALALECEATPRAPAAQRIPERALSRAEVEVADALVAATRQLPWGLLWLDGPVGEQRGWQAVTAAAQSQGLPWHRRDHWQVARVEIDHDWEAYRSHLSRKHRQRLNASLRRLGDYGTVELDLRSQFDPEEIAPLLHRAFSIEDRSWKGEAGSSVLRTPGMLEFFVREARQLAAWGQLELAFLNCGGRPITFAFGLVGKGVFHSFKIGYDAEFTEFSPGQVLKYLLLERFFADPQRRALDCMGPMTEAHARWRPTSYTVSRLMIAPRRGLGSVALKAYRRWRG